MQTSLFRDRDFRRRDRRGTLLYAGGLSALAGLVGLLALVRLKQEALGTDIASVPPN
jgi:hypothetical protein